MDFLINGFEKDIFYHKTKKPAFAGFF